MLEDPSILLILTVFLGLLFLLILLGVPIAVAMGVTSLFIMFFTPWVDFSLRVVTNNMFFSLNSFTLLAVPFYLMLGRLMNAFGLTEEVFDFAMSLVGHIRGGLGQVNVVASLVFSGMSGLAVADVAGLGRIEYTAMREYGYDKDLSLGITSTSSIIGPIMPPSVPIIVYAVLAEVSIGAMFLAGIIPAFLLAGVLMLFVYFIAYKRGYEVAEGFDVSEIWHTFWEALPALFIPVFIIVGILGGWFTATEAGAIALLYVVIVGIKRGKLSLSDIYNEMKFGTVETFAIVFIIAAAGIYSFVAIQLRLPLLIADALLGLTENTVLIMIILAGSFIILGTFMEKLSAIALLVPILLPTLGPLGIDPIYFGIVMVLSLMFGLITPPVGGGIFVLEKVTDATLEEVILAVIPFYIPVLFTLLLVILFPSLSTFLVGFM